MRIGTIIAIYNIYATMISLSMSPAYQSRIISIPFASLSPCYYRYEWIIYITHSESHEAYTTIFRAWIFYIGLIWLAR